MKKDMVGTDKPLVEQLSDNLDRPERHNIGGSMNRSVRNEDPLSPRNLGHQHKLDGNHIRGILDERGARYGTFEKNALVSQQLKNTLKLGTNWKNLDDTHKEGLEMICHKMSRFINGDSAYLDTVVDIIGYATLMKEEIDGKTKMEK